MNITIAELGTALVLRARTAAELMTPSPISIRAEATIEEAVATLVDKALTAAPVIDESGRPIGVVSRTDLLVHDRQRGDSAGRLDKPNTM